jgi:hypothetical protein
LGVEASMAILDLHIGRRKWEKELNIKDWRGFYGTVWCEWMGEGQMGFEDSMMVIEVGVINNTSWK